MKEIILIVLIILALISASFSQTNSDDPEFIKGPDDPRIENSDIVNECIDFCLEKDEHDTCIKVEVRCDS